jgi:hypothetical protein
LHPTFHYRTDTATVRVWLRAVTVDEGASMKQISLFAFAVMDVRWIALRTIAERGEVVREATGSIPLH